MIDHILGRPSRVVRRTQIFLVLFFWIWRLYRGDGAYRSSSSKGSPTVTSAFGPGAGSAAASAFGKAARSVVGSPGAGGNGKSSRWAANRFWSTLLGRRRRAGLIWGINQRLKQFSPYQLILGTMTILYALRHLDDLLGIGAPEPLANMYSRSYYRATYVNTAFDAGFASAMSIRPTWLKDIVSVLFGAYYLVWVNEGDEVLRRFRALCTVEMLRVTWEKTNNPYIRLFTAMHRPKLPIIRHLTIPRPTHSSRAELGPVKAMLFFSGSEAELLKATELVVDFPGGGFIAMGPECHEERLRTWAKRTGKPVLGIDYGKAPEYPYPWAIEEGFDAYRTLMESKGRCIGIESGQLAIVLTGDSAGGNICTTIMNRILEYKKTAIPRPVSIILAYPALDFNYTSWMSPANLRVLRTEQSEMNIPGMVHGKDHMRHKSPLSVVDDVGKRKKRTLVRPASISHKGVTDTISRSVGAGLVMTPTEEKPSQNRQNVGGGKSQPTSPSISGWTRSLPRVMSTKIATWLAQGGTTEDESAINDNASEATDSDDDDENGVIETGGVVVQREPDNRREADKSLKERVKTPKLEYKELSFMTPTAMTTTSQEKVDEDEEKNKLGVNNMGRDSIQRRTNENDRGEVAVVKKKKAPIGTRLTMTSRVGYFQDRIISPSMMRAMAILYIGPRRCPDFETDYYVSPILSPPQNLAHFPPVYLICGERDPFVDDTVIFAGKIREAKRTRRAQAESLSNFNRSARYGESLRMTSTGSADQRHNNNNNNNIDSNIKNNSNQQQQIPDHILRETDDDWVQMRIIEGWGHGFMQMTSLMREVQPVLLEMADWIDESFERARIVERDIQDIAAAHAAARATFSPGAPVMLSPTAEVGPPPPTSTHVRPGREYTQTPSNKALGGADLGGALAPDAAGDDEDSSEGVLTFTPKAKRRNPPPSRFNPVPRRPSKETLDLHRSTSAPKFDADETGSSGEAMIVKTPPLGTKVLPTPIPPKGSGAFAFFSNRGGAASAPAGVRTPKEIPLHMRGFPYSSVPHSRGGNGTVSAGPGASPSIRPGNAESDHHIGQGGSGGWIGASIGGSGGTGAPIPASLRQTNSLVAAAVAGARAASPALAAAAFGPQTVGNVTEAELMRRRRLEATFGMGETDSAVQSDDDDV